MNVYESSSVLDVVLSRGIDVCRLPVGTQSYPVPARTSSVPDRTGQAMRSRRATTSSGQQRALSEPLHSGDQLPLAHLSTPSLTLTPAGVGRNTSRGSWELTPPLNVLDGLDIDIDQEGQAILEDILPSKSRVTHSPTSAREFAARLDLMICGVASGSIKQALRPHLQREYHITDQDIAEAATNGRGRSTTPRRGPPGAAAEAVAAAAVVSVAAVILLHHHLLLNPLHHPVVHRVVVEAVAVEVVGDAHVV